MTPEVTRDKLRAGKNAPSTWRYLMQSLQFKASAVIVVLIIAITGTGTLLSMRTLRQALLETEFQRANDLAASLSSLSSHPLEQRDRVKLEALIDELIADKRIGYAVYADSQNHIISSAEAAIGLTRNALDHSGSQIALRPPFEPKVVEHPRYGFYGIDIVVPVYGPPEPSQSSTRRPIIGNLRLGMDITSTQRKLEHVAGQLVQAAIAVVLLALPCSLLMLRFVVAPLNLLASTARAIASGAMDERASINATGEMGELATAFNTMADRVVSSQMELIALNSELEKRVAQRTRELEELASRDPLTGLYNRRHFSEVIAQAFAAAERYDDDLTVLMFDVDHFKETNDRFGHRTGDKVLILLANAISNELRESDVAARFGGDEFILLLSHSVERSATTLAERIMHTFEISLNSECPGVPATLSIGVAGLKQTRARSSEALIHEADVALYTAKQNGRNQAVMAEPHVAAG